MSLTHLQARERQCGQRAADLADADGGCHGGNEAMFPRLQEPKIVFTGDRLSLRSQAGRPRHFTTVIDAHVMASLRLSPMTPPRSVAVNLVTTESSPLGGFGKYSSPRMRSAGAARAGSRSGLLVAVRGDRMEAQAKRPPCTRNDRYRRGSRYSIAARVGGRALAHRMTRTACLDRALPRSRARCRKSSIATSCGTICAASADRSRKSGSRSVAGTTLRPCSDAELRHA